MSNGEQFIETNGVELCIETFGDSADPAIVLIHGACASMVWWESALCERIAAAGRYVIRFDNRDVGRSTSYPPGRPGYALSDLARDAVGILDELGVEKAHFVGRSMSGATAATLGVDHPDRVLTLTFVCTTPGDDDLPGMSDEFMEYTSDNPDPDNTEETTEWIVGLMKVYSGNSPYFDENAMRELAELDVARTRNLASALGNHFMINFDAPQKGGFGDIKAPSLVVHGSEDPVFPLPHGKALQKAIPGAELFIMDKAGHEVPEPLWDEFVSALVKHTAG